MQKGPQHPSLSFRSAGFLVALCLSTVGLPGLADGIVEPHCGASDQDCDQTAALTLAQADMTGHGSRRIRLDSLSRDSIERAARGETAQPVGIVEIAESPAESVTLPAALPPVRKAKPEPVWRDLPEGPIRAVGPAFFPDREVRQGLRVPGRTGDR